MAGYIVQIFVEGMERNSSLKIRNSKTVRSLTNSILQIVAYFLQFIVCISFSYFSVNRF